MYNITCVFCMMLCRQVTGWLEDHPSPSPSEDIPFQDGALVSSPPIMEPTKVQSEGGLNVTLTIRLLMHGKVSRHRLLYRLRLKWRHRNFVSLSNRVIYLKKKKTGWTQVRLISSYTSLWHNPHPQTYYPLSVHSVASRLKGSWRFLFILYCKRSSVAVEEQG